MDKRTDRQITLTESEFQALCGLLDAGIRAVGMRGVKHAAVLLDKLQGASLVEVVSDLVEVVSDQAEGSSSDF